MDINEKLDKILENQETQSQQLEELSEQVAELDEAVKNLNLTARDYGVEDYE